jgi:putative oxidoreductase
MKSLSRFDGLAYAAMRIVVGALFACHGAGKLFGALGGHKVAPAFSQMFLAGLIEFGCGVAVAIGFQTAIAAFLASGEMAVGYFQAHAHKGFWPILNGGEDAVLYCFVFLFIAAHGSGALSLDVALGRSKK